MERYLLSDLALEQGLSGSAATVNGFRLERADGVTSIRLPLQRLRTDLQKTLAQKTVSEELCRLFPKDFLRSNAPVTVICLGNPAITADSLGALCADGIAATRAFRKAEPSTFSALGGREITVLRSGVAGHSGIEARELLLSCIPLLKPGLIIAIDSLRAVRTENLSATVQISARGISPGAAAGNKRAELSEASLGVPVISIGVPTAISSQALICTALKSAGISSLSEQLEEVIGKQASFTVSASDIDRSVKLFADVIAKAINLTFLGFAEI